MASLGYIEPVSKQELHVCNDTIIFRLVELLPILSQDMGGSNLDGWMQQMSLNFFFISPLKLKVACKKNKI